jgi:HSP20 family protein
MVPVPQNGSLPLAVENPVGRLSTLFDRFFNDDIFTPLPAAQVAAIPLSMWEDEDHFYVEVDVPGMTENDIDVSVHNGALRICGERKSEHKGNGYDTRSYGRFEQQISLPTWAKADKVEAKLNNGVLALTFPKGEEAKPRKIALKKGTAQEA